jgi:hypothetical protein
MEKMYYDNSNQMKTGITLLTSHQSRLQSKETYQGGREALSTHKGINALTRHSNRKHA